MTIYLYFYSTNKVNKTLLNPNKFSENRKQKFVFFAKKVISTKRDKNMAIKLVLQMFYELSQTVSNGENIKFKKIRMNAEKHNQRT